MNTSTRFTDERPNLFLKLGFSFRLQTLKVRNVNDQSLHYGGSVAYQNNHCLIV